MKRKKFLGIFSKNPMIWLHYVILTGALFGGYYLGDYLFNLSYTEWYWMALWFFVVISVSDQLIHKILGVD